MKKIIIMVVLQFFALLVQAQICNKGPQDKMPPKEESQDPTPSAEGNTQVYTPQDPNEIIGTKGYDALGDTLQWVAATASLPYTIYFENDPELATAAAQKVEIRHAYYSIMN